MTKPKILIFIDHYLPGFKSGGPVRTISNLVDHLSEEFHFLIVTRDRDFQNPTPYSGVQIGAWNWVGGAQVFYAPPNLLTLRGVARLIHETDHDLIYLNSFFSLRMTIIPRLCMLLGLAPRRPFIVAPRGEFAPSALSLKSTKKRSFLSVSKLLGLYRGAVWHASAEHEAADISREMGCLANEVRIATNLPRVATNLPRIVREPTLFSAHTSHSLRVVFLSRISPMKNLDFALRVLNQVNSYVLFDIYGPVEDVAYWRKCQDLIRELPDSVTVTYRGCVASDQVGRVFSNYDLFLFPTRGENYGHVIAEALSVGTPVLTSDRTPWRNLRAEHFGWDLPLDDEKEFSRVLDSCSLSTSPERLKRRELIREKISVRLRNPEILKSHRELFISVMKKDF